MIARAGEHGSPSSVGISREDARIIAGQIGRDRVSPGTVARRCRHGCPVLILMGEGCASPGHGPEGEGDLWGAAADLLWLTCPFLHDAIHGLETRGYVKKIESFLDGAAEFSEEAQASHEDFISLRRISFPRLLSRGKEDPLREEIAGSGVGGRRGAKGLKCLHAHFAHYLLNGRNIVGSITSRLLGDLLECDDARCRRFV
ncbi:MAG: DUF501 domain-containing protein [Spirochaetes bacterium]|nr:DUF501 domain-containing protein [Spirochaetota bacterium]